MIYKFWIYSINESKSKENLTNVYSECDFHFKSTGGCVPTDWLKLINEHMDDQLPKYTITQVPKYSSKMYNLQLIK